MSPGEREAIQRQLHAAGLYDRAFYGASAEPIQFGKYDLDSRQAFTRALTLAEDTGDLDSVLSSKLDEALLARIAGGRGGGQRISEGAIQSGMAQIRALHRAYAMPITESRIRQLGTSFARGSTGLDSIIQQLQGEAVRTFPGIAGALQQGQTVEQIFDTYRATAARTLEIPEEFIDLSDPKWRRAIHSPDEQGNFRAMDPYQWQTTLRTDPAYGWRFTRGANEEAANMALNIAKTFGRAA